MKLIPKKNNGFAIIEVLISLSVVAIIVVSFQTLINQVIRASRVNQSEFKANIYLKEYIEIAKVLERSGDGGWTKIDTSCSVTNKCYFSEQGSTWDKTSGAETLDTIYTRSFYVESVNADTKKFIATISWYNSISNRSLNLETYVYQGIY